MDGSGGDTPSEGSTPRVTPETAHLVRVDVPDATAVLASDLSCEVAIYVGEADVALKRLVEVRENLLLRVSEQQQAYDDWEADMKGSLEVERLRSEGAESDALVTQEQLARRVLEANCEEGFLLLRLGVSEARTKELEGTLEAEHEATQAMVDEIEGSFVEGGESTTVQTGTPKSGRDGGPIAALSDRLHETVARAEKAEQRVAALEAQLREATSDPHPHIDVEALNARVRDAETRAERAELRAADLESQMQERWAEAQPQVEELTQQLTALSQQLDASREERLTEVEALRAEVERLSVKTEVTDGGVAAQEPAEEEDIMEKSTARAAEVELEPEETQETMEELRVASERAAEAERECDTLRSRVAQLEAALAAAAEGTAAGGSGDGGRR
eukprot:Hpha_TRINITY_DN15135_c4_g1::TRINITY_DN15135_c4_g1_i7::g.128314::m.128314